MGNKTKISQQTTWSAKTTTIIQNTNISKNDINSPISIWMGKKKIANDMDYIWMTKHYTRDWSQNDINMKNDKNRTTFKKRHHLEDDSKLGNFSTTSNCTNDIKDEKQINDKEKGQNSIRPMTAIQRQKKWKMTNDY